MRKNRINVEGEPVKKPRSRTARMKVEAEATLLTAASAILPSVAPSEGMFVVPEPLLFATNHLNLVSILSCGYIKPRSGFIKYYADLLEISNGWIPLIRGPLPVTVVRKVTEESPTLPVALQLAPEAAKASNGTGWIAAGNPISASEIVAVHFRTAEDKNAAMARVYEGIDLSILDLRVSPDLFEQSAVNDDALVWLANLPEHNKSFEFRKIDRSAGAIAAVLSMSATTAVSPADIAEMLDLPHERSNAFVLREIRFDEALADDGANPDAMLLAAAMRVLRAADRFASWDPAAIVKSVRDEVARSGAGRTEPIVEMLRRMWRIVRLEAEYGDFGSRQGGNAANALLWVLTRPDPEAIFDSPGKFQVSDWTRVAAAILLGVLNGFELMPSSMRRYAVAKLLWDWQALRLEVTSAEPRRLDARIDESDGSWTLRLGSIDVATGQHAPCDVAVAVAPARAIEEQGLEEGVRYEITASSEDCTVLLRDGRITIHVVGPLSIKRAIDEDALQLRKSKAPSASQRRVSPSLK